MPHVEGPDVTTPQATAETDADDADADAAEQVAGGPWYADFDATKCMLM